MHDSLHTFKQPLPSSAVELATVIPLPARDIQCPWNSVRKKIIPIDAYVGSRQNLGLDVGTAAA